MFDHLHMLPLGAFEPRIGGGMRLYGGKGNSAPPPDPRLIEAQIKSMGIQDDAIQGIMDLGQRMQPLQEQQMQFALDANKTAFDQSQADRGYALERRGQLTGLQDQALKDASEFNTGDRAAELAAKSGSDVEQSFAGQRQASARSLARRGVGPNSGQSAALDAALGLAEASTKAGLSSSVRESARNEGRVLTDRASNMLSGYPSMGMAATGSGAGYASNGVNIANAAVGGMNATHTSAANSAGQMGSNATGMYGAQANYQANMQQQDQTGSIMGGVGGLAMGAAKLGIFSDRRLKCDIVRVGADDTTGLPLYHFTYRDLPGRRYEGVMSDDVRESVPAAVTVDPSGFDRVDYDMLGIEMKEVA